MLGILVSTRWLNASGQGQGRLQAEGSLLVSETPDAPFSLQRVVILEQLFPPSKSWYWMKCPFVFTVRAKSLMLPKLASFLAHLSLHFQAGLCQGHGQCRSGYGLRAKGVNRLILGLLWHEGGGVLSSSFGMKLRAALGYGGCPASSSAGCVCQGLEPLNGWVGLCLRIIPPSSLPGEIPGLKPTFLGAKGCHLSGSQF